MMHVPGPWKADGLEIRCNHSRQRETPFASVQVRGISSDCAIATARLIAAAPDLLAMLNEAQAAIDVLADDAADCGFERRAKNATELAMRIRAAIAKATNA